jgi:hypothetical protein
VVDHDDTDGPEEPAEDSFDEDAIGEVDYRDDVEDPSANTTALPPKLGLQEALENRKQEPSIIMQTSGDPPKDLPVEADFEYGRPRQSVVHIRPWLLGHGEGVIQAGGPSAAGPAGTGDTEGDGPDAVRPGGIDDGEADGSDPAPTGPSDPGSSRPIDGSPDA